MKNVRRQSPPIPAHLTACTRYKAVAAAVLTLCVIASPHRAQAMIEFCPAVLHRAPVGTADPKGPLPAAALYGFDLSALGARSLDRATLAFDTTAGWFTAKVPAVAFGEKLRHYTSVTVRFVRRDWVSPIMYVRFPVALKISHAWVFDAQVHGDGPFGWEAKGDVTCSPPSTAETRAGRNDIRLDPKLDPKDEDALWLPPGPASIVLDAQSAKALETTSCSDPFRPATAVYAAQPAYPDELTAQAPSGVTLVELAINRDGSRADAWIWAPSGYAAFDEAALNAAKASRFENARSYCTDVPGQYLFKVTFLPY